MVLYDPPTDTYFRYPFAGENLNLVQLAKRHDAPDEVLRGVRSLFSAEELTELAEGVEEPEPEPPVKEPVPSPTSLDELVKDMLGEQVLLRLCSRLCLPPPPNCTRHLLLSPLPPSLT